MAQLLHTVSSSNVLQNIPSLHLQRIRNTTAGLEEIKRSNGGGSLNAPFLAITSSDLCHINVSGRQYIVTYKCLENYPDSLLGSSDREKYYIPELKAYYFNRNRDCFESILTFYQTGREFRPLSVDEEIYESERAFFRIDENNSETTLTIDDGSLASSNFLCNKGWIGRKKRIHRFLMDPRSSGYATFWHVLDIVFICVSITLLVLETDPVMGHYFSEKENATYYYLYYTNVLVISFFSADLMVRFITWPNALGFFKNLFNILDLLSILPFYVSMIADATKDPDTAIDHTHKTYVVLRVCRIFRIVRVFKFIRHSQDLIMIIRVVVHAKKELGLLVLLLGIFSMSFGSLMYYIEHPTNAQFTSIMQGCWWAIVTITTIGYGDVTPETWLGKVVGSLVLTLGIVFLALPMTIIVSKFSTIYEKEKGTRL